MRDLGCTSTRVSVSFFCIIIFVLGSEAKKSKYSEEMNLKDSPRTEEFLDSPKDFKKLDNPFRMQKINMLWHKAVKRLPENKLKNLYADLKSQDKDELILKKIKSESQDKSGIKESSVRRQLTAIIKRYGLSEPSADPESNKTGKDITHEQLFKYKNLNKLWSKAERIGFEDVEMETLREEFQHHEEKLDQYYMLMDGVNEPLTEKVDSSNSILEFLDDEEQARKTAPTNKHQLLKERHRDLQDNYEKLVSKVSTDKKEFEEHKVQNLWDLAKQANFTPSELKSLKSELHHYENRIRKLRFFQSELDGSESHGKNKHYSNEQIDQKHLERKVKDYKSKVSKIHNEIEGRILQKHSEL